ncbi:MAG: hypothetical protein BWY77_01058 [bacterium ADurb.Bin431]|nr:MAG: hypothetical protein BWY77_01058 [bacterium ADurb.Bin431]
MIKGALGDADRLGGHAGTGAVEGLHGDDESHPLLAEQILTGDGAVLKDHLAGGRGADAHLLLFLAEDQSRRPLLDEEGGGAAGPARGIGGGDDGVIAGYPPVGDKMLGAVEDVAVALEPGGGLDRPRVRSCLRFGQTESGQPLPGSQHGKVPALLFIGTGNQEGKGAEGRAGQGQGDAAAGSGELFGDQGHLCDAASHPFILLRNPEAEKVHARHLADDGPGELGTPVIFRCRRGDGAGSEFTGQLLQGGLHLGQIIVHHPLVFSCF